MKISINTVMNTMCHFKRYNGIQTHTITSMCYKSLHARESPNQAPSESPNQAPSESPKEAPSESPNEAPSESPN